jgi:nitrous oxidase accessory protein NosD
VARRERTDALIAPHRWLNLAFFALIGVMAFHQSEHFAQVMQKDVALERCPEDCRGLLGFWFDVEWVHFAYNWSIFIALVVVYFAYGIWKPEWRAAAAWPWWAMTSAIFVVQLYHVVEHTAKLQQWLTNGHVSPTPGLLGKEVNPPIGRQFSLIELHWVFNTIVFVLVVAAYFGFGFHRHIVVRPVRVPAWAPAVVVAVPLLFASALAWAKQVPTIHLSKGVHQGPIVLDKARKLVGADGAVVRGGIVVTASGVTIRNVTVEGGEHGVEVVGAKGVVLDHVRVIGAKLDGISLRRSNARIRKCVIESRGRYVQGIDISFAIDLPPTTVTGCKISGGQEGIVTHSAMIDLRNNQVTRTRLRGIAVTEMSMGMVHGNKVTDALGVGIYCGDHSMCEIEHNRVAGTRPDTASSDGLRAGVGILSLFHAEAELKGNDVASNPEPTSAWANGQITSK